jgi:hypothetical protein
MGSVHARGDTFLTFGLKALTETNTSRLATDLYCKFLRRFYNWFRSGLNTISRHYMSIFFIFIQH